MMEKFMVNLTPHTIRFIDSNGEVIHEVPSSGIARAEQRRIPICTINGIAVNKTEYGEVIGLPEPVEGTIYIVSVLTAQAARGRSDVYIVDDLVRDSAGRIIGCRGLTQR